MAEFTDLVTVITVLKNLITSGLSVDSDTRERVGDMTDEEVVKFARTLLAETEADATEFINRLEGLPD